MSKRTISYMSKRTLRLLCQQLAPRVNRSLRGMDRHPIAPAAGGTAATKFGGFTSGIDRLACRLRFLCVAAGILLACGPVRSAETAWSEQTVADRADRAQQAIRAGLDAFRVTTEGDVASAKAQALEKMMALGATLDASAAHGQDWKDYLLWDRLSAQLTGAATADADELADLLDRFTRDHPGLELPAILQLRAALSRYRYRLLAVGDDALREEFADRLEQLDGLVGVTALGFR